ncbi:MAG: trigger factor [Chloroflexi bacterium]|nr:trigger factor [Chloroflexota bacterium]MCY4246953.1 trigger factor [Chloroflexota bacterium]
MNLQVERIDNHKARLTVEIESAQFESAKRKAARKISRQVNIRGFRKGKAPYSRVAQTVGEAAIIEEAVDGLTQDIYGQALQESKVDPYGPGELEDIELDPPTFIYTLPMRPVIDLKEYQEVRIDYEAPVIDESDVDARLRQYQMQLANVLDDEVEAAQLGHRVYIDVDSTFLDGDEPADDEDAETAEPEQGEGAQPVPSKGDVFVSEKNTPIILDPNEDPFIDGFVENLVDAQLGDDVVFALTIPDDDADPTIAGRLVEFVVTVNRIEAIFIPDLDDEFARAVNKTRNKEASDLAALRASLRDELEADARQRYDNEYVDQLISRIRAGADLHYPELAVEYQLNHQLREFKGRIAQQGVNFDDFIRFTGGSEADLRENLRDESVRLLENSLVMGKLKDDLGTDVTDEDINARFEAVTAPLVSEPIDDKQTKIMRDFVREQVELSHMRAKLVALGRGEDMAAAVEARRAEAAVDLQRALEDRDRNRASLDEESVADLAVDAIAGADASTANAPDSASES